jgi:Mlc titration factor MtfA (ptsG expression regulator)
MISAIVEKRWFRKLLFLAFRNFKEDTQFVIPYSKLTLKQRTEFIWRAKFFLDTTDFDFREFDNYDPAKFEKVKYLIASVAAQMTFRLHDQCFDIYSRIIIYPDYFYSRAGKHYHKGETNPGAGVIVFSLRGITEGFELPFDGVNLIFHEFAHALYLEHKGMDYNLFDEDALDEVGKYTTRTFQTELKPDYFLRDYALTNAAEFFAVSVENFFERSEEFSKKLPELYKLLVRLFRFDPIKLK